MTGNRVRAAIASLLLGISAGGAAPPPSGPDSSFAMGSEALVDPDRGLLHLMSADGGIEAVEIATGRSAWKSNAAVRPLAISGNLLVAQGEGPALRIAALDLSAGGRTAREASLELPVAASIRDGMGTSFGLAARPRGREVLLLWNYSQQYVGGAAPGPDTPHGTQASGVARFDLESGRLEALSDADAAAAREEPPAEAIRRGADPSAPAGEWRFHSEDGRHVLVATRAPVPRGGPPGGAYAWSIREIPGERVVGTMRSDDVSAQFFVHGGIFVRSRNPGGRRREDGEWEEIPKGVQALDLGTGREVWTRAVADTAYRGPYPPSAAPGRPPSPPPSPAPRP